MGERYTHVFLWRSRQKLSWRASFLLLEDADKKSGCSDHASCTASENNKSDSCECHAGYKGDGHLCTGNNY